MKTVTKFKLLFLLRFIGFRIERHLEPARLGTTWYFISPRVFGRYWVLPIYVEDYELVIEK